MARSVSYRVRVRIRGQLSPTWWSGLFSSLTVEDEPAGTTLLSGEVTDQAALHGLLDAIRDLGLTLVSVDTAACATAEPETRGGTR